jgi:hemerythrin-like domain-containing protein
MPNRPPASPTDDAPESASLRALGNPLDFILADHLREREVCAVLDRIATADLPDADAAVAARGFLAEALPLHLADEERDLFPLLHQRCEPDDEIDRAIRKLTDDHRHAARDTPDIIATLDAIAVSGVAPSAAARAALIEYAGHARRHLVLENAIVLPFARLRLTEDDLDRLARGMVQRRGLDRLLRDGLTGRTRT